MSSKDIEVGKMVACHRVSKRRPPLAAQPKFGNAACKHFRSWIGASNIDVFAYFEVGLFKNRSAVNEC